MDTITAQDELSEREIEIVSLLNEGMTNHEIAENTGLTLYTVKWYLKQIYGKLHVSNRTQAAARARELGLLEDDTQTTASITSNLPETLTPFFGREAELTHLGKLLNDDTMRLITLHGAGGMGKTRLAIQVARTFEDAFPDGVFFVPLARFSGDPLDALATTLELPLDSTDETLSELSALLKDKRTLLVLDNFEHMSAQAFRITSLLERTQSLCILVTSREILHIQAEVVFPLDGLQVPNDKTGIETTGAYRLFLQRARSSYVDFSPAKAEQRLIGEICELLGGMPLAIEIAAGWASVLSVEETLERLHTNLDLLMTDERDRPARQQSIRATLDYSWNLLSPHAQEVLVSLSVFDPTGFSYDAAEKIADATPIIIKQLLDTALLQRSGHQRFTFHPLIRQYLTERLNADDTLREAVRTKHGDYYFDFVMHHIEAFRQNLDLNIVYSFLRETFNLDVAWHFALEYKRYDWLEAASEVGYLCELVALWKETDILFAKTLEQVPETYQVLRGRLLAFRAIYAYRDYDLEAMRTYAAQSWDILKETNYAWDAGSALAYLAVAEAFLGNESRGLEILNRIETLLHRNDLPVNVYAQGAIVCARPTYLLYAGQSEDAAQILEHINVPGWHEVNIRLPEAYIALGKYTEARKTLEKLYNKSLDNRYYKAAVYAAFYLAVIDSTPETMPEKVVQALRELTHISEHYPVIAKLAYYFGTLLTRREHPTWGKLLFYSNLHMLHDLGELSLMYQYAVRTAQALTAFEPDTANQLFLILAHDSACPPNIQEKASQQLTAQSAFNSDTGRQSFLAKVADLLIAI